MNLLPAFSGKLLDWGECVYEKHDNPAFGILALAKENASYTNTPAPRF